MKPDENEGRKMRPLVSSRIVWSGLLSLIFPGLGQIHARSWKLGATLLGVTVAGGVIMRLVTWLRPEPAILAVFFALAAGCLLLALWAAADAVRRTHRLIEVPRARWFHSTWFAFVVLLAAGIGVRTGLPSGWRNFSIPAGSMSPSVLVGDYVAVGTRQSGTLPGLGDIVVFKYPRDTSIDYIKRIVGLPGDRVQMKQGQLYINGQACPRETVGHYDTNDGGYVLHEKLYLETLPNGMRYQILKATDGTEASRQPGFDPAKQFDPNNTIEYVVPLGHVFAMGDHRDNSADSRFINAVGYVPIGNLVGRAESLFFSIDAAHPWYEAWWWPFEIRWSRLLRRIH